MSEKLSGSSDDLSIVGDDCCSSKLNYDDCLKRLQTLEQLINEQNINIKDVQSKLLEDKEKNEVKFKDLEEKNKSLEIKIFGEEKKKDIKLPTSKPLFKQITPIQPPLIKPLEIPSIQSIDDYLTQMMPMDNLNFKQFEDYFNKIKNNQKDLNDLPKFKEEIKKLTEELTNAKNKISELEIKKIENEKKIKEEIEKVENEKKEKDQLEKQNSFLSKQIEEFISSKNSNSEIDLKELIKLKEECQKLNEENKNYLNKNNQLIKQLEEKTNENELNLIELNKFRNLKYGRIILKIEKFSEFAREKPDTLRKSETIYIGGFPWYIEVKPKEKGKYLGFYATCNGQDKDSSWECSASTLFKILPYKSQNQNNYWSKFSHIYQARECCWGYSQFKTFEEIMKPLNGWYNDKDDNITLCVEVTIDETQ